MLCFHLHPFPDLVTIHSTSIYFVKTDTYTDRQTGAPIEVPPVVKKLYQSECVLRTLTVNEKKISLSCVCGLDEAC